MKAIIALALAAFILSAGCAGGGAQSAPSKPSTGNQGGAGISSPQGGGFAFSDNSTLKDTNGSGSTTAPPAPAPSPPQNNTTPAPITSGSGGQIVDVGGSIPVTPTPSGSGN